MPVDPTHNFDPVTERCTLCGYPRIVAGALKPCVKAAPVVEKADVDWFGLIRSAG